MPKQPKAYPGPKMARKTNAASPLPADLSVDDPHNWDFASVFRGAGDELKACCRWEYARESASLRNTVRMLHEVLELVGDNVPFAGLPQALQIMLDNKGQSEVSAHGLWFDLAGTGLLNFTVCFHVPLTKPWRSLNDDHRRMLAAHFKGWNAPSSGPAFQDWDDAEVLRELYERACKDRDEIKALSSATPSERRAMSLADRKENRFSVVSDGGLECLLVKIDWRYSDKDIKRAFNQWVDRKKRPGCSRKPRGRPPRTLDYGAALRCLAIMRVSRDHKPAEVAAKFTSLYLSCNKKLRRDADRALKYLEMMVPPAQEFSPSFAPEEVDK
jgi:hypothetical protein